MTVAIEAAAPARAVAKKVAKKKAKPAKVQGVHTLPPGGFEVTMFLGAFDTVEEAIAAREKGIALRDSFKAKPKKKTAKAVS